MGGRALTPGSHSQQLRLAHAVGRQDMLNGEHAPGQGAGLIHDDGLYIADSLHRAAALKENILLGAQADAGKESQRHAEHQCAGAGDDQEGQGGLDPVIPVSGDDGGD